ncbi:MAG: hypothetical protein GF349_01085 [Candidatus Magasanikbacteria bacterium]|nr:hypothetical protein [Candidatus Magasanikbacteria bacterium]
MYIVIDGIDGSGKSTVIKAWADFFVNQNKKVFDLKNYWQKKHCHPNPGELDDYDVVVSAEPTTVWAGASIRQEMILNGKNYTPTSMADAYALDRMVLLKRLILPLRSKNKIILQDRSVSTSICYQPLQTNSNLKMDDIAAIEGNTYALNNAPEHLVIADVNANEAINRLSGRVEKQDLAIFEKKNFLEKAAHTFKSPDYQKYFTERGTQIHLLDCNEKIDIMKQRGIELLQSII